MELTGGGKSSPCFRRSGDMEDPQETAPPGETELILGKDMLVPDLKHKKVPRGGPPTVLPRQKRQDDFVADRGKKNPLTVKVQKGETFLELPPPGAP